MATSVLVLATAAIVQSATAATAAPSTPRQERVTTDAFGITAGARSCQDPNVLMGTGRSDAGAGTQFPLGFSADGPDTGQGGSAATTVTVDASGHFSFTTTDVGIGGLSVKLPDGAATIHWVASYFIGAGTPVIYVGTFSISGAGPCRIVGMASSPAGDGYWLATPQGVIESFGGAADHGFLDGHSLNSPVVGLAPAPDGGGYWLVAADGGVFTFGTAAYFGSKGGQPLNAPIVGMAATPDGRGYWLVAADGGVFAFGTAAYFGSKGGTSLHAPVVGMSSTPGGTGYWLVAADGGVFTFGTAAFRGSLGGRPLNAPVVGMAAAPDGGGYWLVAADGGVFAFGAPYLGSAA